MDAAGIDLTTSSLWNVWVTNVNQEIARRQSLKRSISTSSLPRTLSEPSLSLDVSAASSSRSARSVGDVSSGICVSESMDVDRKSMVSFSHPRDHARDHVNVRAGEEFAIVWPPSPVRASQILQVQPSDKDTPSVLARMTEDMRFTSISSMTKDDLVSLCVNAVSLVGTLETKLDEMKKSRKGWYQNAYRLGKRLDKTKEQIQDLKNPQVDPLDVKGHCSLRVPWRGMIALGLRKGIILVSANSYPAASLIEVSRQTVSRAEVLCAAYLITRTNMFHQLVYKLLFNLASHRRGNSDAAPGDNDDYDDRHGVEGNRAASDGITTIVSMNDHCRPPAPVYSHQSHDEMICKQLALPPLDDVGVFTRMVSDGGHYCLGTTAFCGDATNSSIWQKQKLQGLLVSTSLLTDWSSLKNIRYDDAFIGTTALSLAITHTFEYGTCMFVL